MMVPDLAAVLRAAGLMVVETPGWQTRNHGPLLGVRTVVCHHTAGPATGDFPSLPVVRDGRPGLAGPLAQLGLARSGIWYTISAGKAWHAGVVLQPDYGNEWSIGIEAEATGHDSWPEVQLASYARGCRALIDHYGLTPARVLGHKEVCSPPGRKTDPNFDMPAFRARIAHTEADMTFTDADARTAWNHTGHAYDGDISMANALLEARNAARQALQLLQLLQAARVPTAAEIAAAVVAQLPPGQAGTVDVAAIAAAVRAEFAAHPLT